MRSQKHYPEQISRKLLEMRRYTAAQKPGDAVLFMRDDIGEACRKWGAKMINLQFFTFSVDL